ncbi:MAG: DUF2934 domain-containing protein [Gemmataceae bacterium]|nr:DUF2934 domain-containing protein [Gemmataceae bacterium]
MAQRPRMPAPARRADPVPAAARPPVAPPVSSAAKIAVASPPAVPQAIDGTALQDRIARLAYDKWCERGCPHGSDMEDWLAAERELRSQSSGNGRK